MLGPALAGLVCGVLAAPSHHAPYLALQAASDNRHRLAIVILPACVLAAGVAWVGLRLGTTRRWMGGGARVVLVAAWALGCAMLAFIVQFDRRIEARGLEGQVVTATAGGPNRVSSFRRIPASGPVRGPVREEDGGPGVALEAGEGGMITLDRRQIACRGPGGTIRWNRPRPGRGPASLMLHGGLLLFIGPGPTYEDDAVMVAMDAGRGTRLWTYHWLARRVMAARAGDDTVALASIRPSGSTVRMLALAPPAPLWITSLEDRVRVPPRLRAGRVQVAADARIVELDPADGRVVDRRRVCPDGRHPEVVCRQGRVVGWRRDEAR